MAITLTYRFLCSISPCESEQLSHYEIWSLKDELPKPILPSTWHDVDGKQICDKHILKLDDQVEFAGMRS